MAGDLLQDTGHFPITALVEDRPLWRWDGHHHPRIRLPNLQHQVVGRYLVAHHKISASTTRRASPCSRPRRSKPRSALYPSLNCWRGQGQKWAPEFRAGVLRQRWGRGGLALGRSPSQRLADDTAGPFLAWDDKPTRTEMGMRLRRTARAHRLPRLLTFPFRPRLSKMS